MPQPFRVQEAKVHVGGFRKKKKVGNSTKGGKRTWGWERETWKKDDEPQKGGPSQESRPCEEKGRGPRKGSYRKGWKTVNRLVGGGHSWEITSADKERNRFKKKKLVGGRRRSMKPVGRRWGAPKSGEVRKEKKEKKKEHSRKTW